MILSGAPPDIANGEGLVEQGMDSVGMEEVKNKIEIGSMMETQSVRTQQQDKEDCMLQERW